MLAMQHLDTDRLAALADEPATAPEAEHLAACVVCRRELEAFATLIDLAHRDGQAGLDPDLPAPLPLTSWDALGLALRAEGLVKSVRTTGTHAVPAAAKPEVHVTRSTGVWWRRAAASIALVAGGAAFGRLTAPRAVDTPVAPQVAALPQTVPTPAPAPDSAATGSRSSLGLSDTLPVAGELPRSAAASSPQVASFDPDAPLTLTGPRQAMQVLTRAQRDYQRAAAYLAEHDTATVTGTPQVLRARLAALDEVMPKVRQALYEAPQDPMLNQYYLTTYEARESTLRQLARALPVGVRLNGF